MVLLWASDWDVELSDCCLWWATVVLVQSSPRGFPYFPAGCERRWQMLIFCCTEKLLHRKNRKSAPVIEMKISICDRVRELDGFVQSRMHVLCINCLSIYVFMCVNFTCAYSCTLFKCWISLSGSWFLPQKEPCTAQLNTMNQHNIYFHLLQREHNCALSLVKKRFVSSLKWLGKK
jgi:hypothetical protein